jgi:hypothetical protein
VAVDCAIPGVDISGFLLASAPTALRPKCEAPRAWPMVITHGRIERSGPMKTRDAWPRWTHIEVIAMPIWVVQAIDACHVITPRRDFGYRDSTTRGRSSIALGIVETRNAKAQLGWAHGPCARSQGSRAGKLGPIEFKHSLSDEQSWSSDERRFGSSIPGDKWQFLSTSQDLVSRI